MIVLRKFGLRFLIFWLSAGVVFSASSADAGDPCANWIGLWRFVPKIQESASPFHLIVSTAEGKDRLVYYQFDFLREFSSPEFSCSGDHLEFLSPQLSTSIKATFDRKGEEASGKIELLHPQFRNETAWDAYRITDGNNWDAVAGVQRKADSLGIIDLVSILEKEGSTDSLDSFDRFWASQISPDFYAIVQDVSFGKHGGPKERRANLETILKLLNDEAFIQDAHRIDQSEHEVFAHIKEALPSLFFTNAFINMPSLGQFSESPVVLQDRLFIRIGVDSDAVRHSPNLKGWLAKEHLKLPLYEAFPPVDTGLAAQVIREGLASFWAVSAGLAKKPTDCLLESSTETTDSSTAEQRARITQAIRAREPVSSEDIILVGYDFAKQLTAAYANEEIVAMKRGPLGERLWNFLTASSN